MTKNSKPVVVTLFEGDYYLGVGALINSLHAVGFRGLVYVAYRGDLSGWAADSVDKGKFRELSAGDGLTVRLVLLNPGWHLANLKPDFMLRVLQEFEPDATSIFYFDPDITVKCRWGFFEEWVNAGVAMVCENYMSPMPASHPFRFAWMNELAKSGFAQKRSVDYYINSGFVGARREEVGFLKQWLEIERSAEKHGHDMKEYKSGDQSQPFNSFDQDWLNCAIMTTDGPISIVGPEGMDLNPGGFIMSHAVETIKPWRPGMGRRVLSGFTPSTPWRRFWSHTQTPLRLYSPTYAKWKRFKIGVAVLIGRFYSKP